MIWTQNGCVLYVCAKFEADCSIRSKVIRGSLNFEFGSRDPKPRPLWDHFMIQTQ